MNNFTDCSENLQIEDYHIANNLPNIEFKNEFKSFHIDYNQRNETISEKNQNLTPKLKNLKEITEFCLDSSDIKSPKSSLTPRIKIHRKSIEFSLDCSEIKSPKSLKSPGFYEMKRKTHINRGKTMNIDKNTDNSSNLQNFRINSKFFKMMLNYYLVKKFIKKLRESTVYRKPQLKDIDFSVINDLSYFTEGIKKLTAVQNFKEIIVNYIKNMIKNLSDIKFIILPTNNIRLLWDFLQMILIIMHFIIIPIKIGFNSDELELDSILSSLQCFSLILFIMDIIINFNTPFYNKGELIVSKGKIFKNYFIGYFLTDVITLVGLGMNEISGNTILQNYVKMAEFLFILRIRNLSKFITKFEEFLFTDERTSKLISFIRLIFNILLFSHWSACIWKLVGDYDEIDGWIKFYNLTNHSPIYQYIYSLYYIVVVTNTVGFGDIVCQTIYERLFTIFFIFIACINFAYTINRIGMILQSINKADEELHRMMNSINAFMKYKNIDFGLKIKIKNYLEYIWQTEKNQNTHETQEIINKLSKSLKEELLINANGVILKDIPLLSRNFSENTLRKIVYEMKEINLTPGDVIYHENDYDELNLFIIRDGEIQLYFENFDIEKKEISLNLLKKDQYFGEMSFFTGMPRKTSAKSLSFSSLFVIKKEVFFNIVKENIEDFEKYCKIKDEINLAKDLNGIFIRCTCCKNVNHTLMECPNLHLVLSSERILEKYNFNIPQERIFISRKSIKKPSPFKNLKHLQSSALKMTQNLDFSSHSISIGDGTIESKSENEFNEVKSENDEETVQSLDDKTNYNAVDLMKASIDKKCTELSDLRKKSTEQRTEGSERKLDIIEEEREYSRKELSNPKYENFRQKVLESLNADKINCEIDSVKNYYFYFPDHNIENLLEKLNEKAEKKLKKLKGFNFNAFLKFSDSISKSPASRKIKFHPSITKEDNFFKCALKKTNEANSFKKSFIEKIKKNNKKKRIKKSRKCLENLKIFISGISKIVFVKRKTHTEN